MRYDGINPDDDGNAETRAALYALLAGTEGCGPAARSAMLVQDDELADFLCRVQVEIVEEAERLLEEREPPEEKVAENLSLEAQG